MSNPCLLKDLLCRESGSKVSKSYSSKSESSDYSLIGWLPLKGVSSSKEGPLAFLGPLRYELTYEIDTSCKSFRSVYLTVSPWSKGTSILTLDPTVTEGMHSETCNTKKLSSHWLGSSKSMIGLTFSLVIYLSRGIIFSMGSSISSMFSCRNEKA